MGRFGFGFGLWGREAYPTDEQPQEQQYLTDEAGNRLLDPAGNLIVYG